MSTLDSANFEAMIDTMICAPDALLHGRAGIFATALFLDTLSPGAMTCSLYSAQQLLMHMVFVLGIFIGVFILLSEKTLLLIIVS